MQSTFFAWARLDFRHSARATSARLGLRKPSCVSTSTSALALAGTSRTRLLRLSGAVRCALLSTTDARHPISCCAQCDIQHITHTRVGMLACTTCVFTLAPMRRTACEVLLCVLRRQQGQEALAAREGDGSKVGGTALLLSYSSAALWEYRRSFGLCALIAIRSAVIRSVN